MQQFRALAQRAAGQAKIGRFPLRSGSAFGGLKDLVAEIAECPKGGEFDEHGVLQIAITQRFGGVMVRLAAAFRSLSIDPVQSRNRVARETALKEVEGCALEFALTPLTHSSA